MDLGNGAWIVATRDCIVQLHPNRRPQAMPRAYLANWSATLDFYLTGRRACWPRWSDPGSVEAGRRAVVATDADRPLVSLGPSNGTLR